MTKIIKVLVLLLEEKIDIASADASNAELLYLDNKEDDRYNVGYCRGEAYGLTVARDLIKGYLLD